MLYRLSVVSVWCDVFHSSYLFTKSILVSFVSEVNGLPQLMQHLCVKNNKYLIFFSVSPNVSPDQEKLYVVQSSGKVSGGKEQISVLLLQNLELQQPW